MVRDREKFNHGAITFTTVNGPVSVFALEALPRNGHNLVTARRAGLETGLTRGGKALRPREAAKGRPSHAGRTGPGLERGYLLTEVPTERRSSQASTMRLAMPVSAILDHARGSYAFLLPTSPSIFRTPS